MIPEKRELRQRKFTGAALGMAAVLLLGACGAKDPGPSPQPTPWHADTGIVVTGPDSYDSADTAILVGKDEKENTLTFLNLNLGKRYTLSVDGTTRFSDKYGRALAMGQIQTGDIVDIRFLKSKKHLTALQLSVRSWSYTDIERFEINPVRGEVSIGADTYKLTSNTQYLSEGKNIGIMDINEKDVLSFYGIDSQVLTVRVDKGHGYLRIVNGESFVGGWIEIGQKQIERIKKDMLLVVPEGSYRVSVSNRGASGEKNVVITRNEETWVDVGEFEVPEPQRGRVTFSVTPAGAELSVDGAKVSASSPVTLEYGLHQMTAKAEGYHPITRYIRVEKEMMDVDVVLEEVRQEDPIPTEAPPESTESPSPGPDDPEETGPYLVYIDAPENVEVYLDGNYIGISPCSFKKSPGIHVIILRKIGYTTRSYTIQVDTDEKDSTYTFMDLVSTGDDD